MTTLLQTLHGQSLSFCRLYYRGNKNVFLCTLLVHSTGWLQTRQPRSNLQGPVPFRRYHWRARGPSLHLHQRLHCYVVLLVVVEATEDEAADEAHMARAMAMEEGVAGVLDMAMVDAH